MKKRVRRIVLGVICVAVIVGAFWAVSSRRSGYVQSDAELTEVQKVITRDLKRSYPQTPREVIKFYNRIICCFYNEEYTEDELYELGDQARILMDDELLENNSRNDYFENLKTDIETYREKSKTIASTSVCDSNEVNYQTIDGDECAYVTASYFINEDKSYSRTYQTYVLRKDKDGNWKILVFYQTEGEPSDEDE